MTVFLTLLQVERIIDEHEHVGPTVAAVLIEPIQGEGGDNCASPDFFRKLQQVCVKVNAFQNVLHSASVRF